MSQDNPAPENPRRQQSILADAKKLQAIRRARRLTQLELAVVADVSERTVRAAETGKRIKLDSLDSIAASLGAALSDVVSDQDEFRLVQLLDTRIDRVLESYIAYNSGWNLQPLADLATPDLMVNIECSIDMPFVGRFCGMSEMENLRDEAANAFDKYSLDLEVKEIRGSGNLIVVNTLSVVGNVEEYGEVRVPNLHIFTLHKDRIQRIDQIIDSHGFQKCFPR